MSVFGYCYNYVFDIVADRFRPVRYVSYLYAFIFLICICIEKRKMAACTPVLRVPASDTLSIIGTQVWTHQYDLGRHIVVLK